MRTQDIINVIDKLKDCINFHIKIFDERIKDTETMNEKIANFDKLRKNKDDFFKYIDKIKDCLGKQESEKFYTKMLDFVVMPNYSELYNDIWYILRFDDKQNKYIPIKASNPERDEVFLDNFFHNIDILLEQCLNISQLQNLEFVKDVKIGENVVVIGANGSGKSSYSRHIRRVFGDSLVVIPAQKVFQYVKTSDISFGDSKLNEFYNFQLSDKLCKDENFGYDLVNDMNRLVSVVISDHYNQTAKEHKTNEKIETIFDKTCDLWCKILNNGRTIELDNGCLIVRGDGFLEYDFANLSDGEKAVFYYVAHILMAKPNSYIVIDEPENHLNFAIINKMWDALENARQDCTFIYLTHNVNFASSRIGARMFWMKSYDSENLKWDIVPIIQDENIPEKLYMEILGSRSKILFCEGKEDSFDYKLYSVMFPEYFIKPVDGHRQVIDSVRAFNKSRDIHGNVAIGIIDMDFHTDREMESWQKDGIYSLQVNEIENIFLDEELVQKAIDRFMCDLKLDAIKNKLLEYFNGRIEYQSFDYTKKIAQYKLNELTIKVNKKEDKENKKEELFAVFDNIKAELPILKDVYNKKKRELDSIYNDKNYSELVKTANDKSFCKQLNSWIIENYAKKIILLIREDDSLKASIKKKYFSHIPSADV